MIRNIVFDISNVLAPFRFKEFLAEKGFDAAMIKRTIKASAMTSVISFTASPTSHPPDTSSVMTASKRIDSIGHFTGLIVGIVCGFLVVSGII